MHVRRRMQVIQKEREIFQGELVCSKFAIKTANFDNKEDFNKLLIYDS